MSVRRAGLSEQQLAAVVVDWLRGQHWDVWQEVKPGWQGQHPVADIMARNGKVIWVVECKLSRSLALLDQVIWWGNLVGFVSIAVPVLKVRPGCHPKESRAWNHVLGYYGIGQLTVDGDDVDHAAPSMHRHKGPLFDRHFHQLLDVMPQNYGTAGAQRTNRWSPFAQTRDRLVKLVGERPGITFKEALADLEHHYRSDATARSSLIKWIGEGSIPLRLVRDGRRLRLYP